MFSKKNILSAVFFVFLAAAVITAIVTAARERSRKYDYGITFFSMDTIVSVQSESNIADDLKSIFDRYDSDLDRNSSLSAAYSLNNDKKGVGSEILTEVIGDTLELNERYGDLVDITTGQLTSVWDVNGENPTVPDESEIKKALETVGTENIVIDGKWISIENGASLDFGAVGKGAALDACFDCLEENGCGKTIVSTGSSILLYGGSFDVDIADPEGNGALASVTTGQCFLSTSGGYERYFEADGKTYCHIINPRTGYPSETDLTTVTVFCNSGIESDFLSTMIFLEGSKNIGKYLDSNEYKIFAADKNKKLYISSGLDYEVYNEQYSE
ncbi:MAG: FAD:protein FMN transferase [Clostridium sp.]|nr:FAD:protein FMN transferase [Clostridium sp.]MCM1548181.1 FAD:protein FMN transferase [Ruminococcus sp.]